MAAYKNIVLMVLSKWDNPSKPGTGFELRVVHTLSDNKSKGVGVEKVYFYADASKSVGKPLSRADFKRVGEKWKEIAALMDNPPPVPKAPDPEPLAATGDLGGGTLEKGEF